MALIRRFSLTFSPLSLSFSGLLKEVEDGPEGEERGRRRELFRQRRIFPSLFVCWRVSGTLVVILSSRGEMVDHEVEFELEVDSLARRGSPRLSSWRDRISFSGGRGWIDRGERGVLRLGIGLLEMQARGIWHGGGGESCRAASLDREEERRELVESKF